MEDDETIDESKQRNKNKIYLKWNSIGTAVLCVWWSWRRSNSARLFAWNCIVGLFKLGWIHQECHWTKKEKKSFCFQKKFSTFCFRWNFKLMDCETSWKQRRIKLQDDLITTPNRPWCFSTSSDAIHKIVILECTLKISPLFPLSLSTKPLCGWLSTSAS